MRKPRNRYDPSLAVFLPDNGLWAPLFRGPNADEVDDFIEDDGEWPNMALTSAFRVSWAA